MTQRIAINAVIVICLLLCASSFFLWRHVRALEQAQESALTLAVAHQAELDMLVEDVYGVEVGE